jgi:MFS family permease
VAPVAGRLSDRFGSRGFMAVGPLVAAVGLGLLLRTDLESPYLTVLLPGFVVLAGGMAMTMTPMTAAVMGSVETRHAGVASAATNTSRELGGVFGVALLGAVVTSAFRRGFLANLVAAGMSRAEAAAVVARAGTRAAAGNAVAGAPPAVVAAAQGSFVHAVHVGMMVAMGFMLLAAVVSAVFVRSHVGARDAEADREYAA